MSVELDTLREAVLARNGTCASCGGLLDLTAEGVECRGFPTLGKPACSQDRAREALLAEYRNGHNGTSPETVLHPPADPSADAGSVDTAELLETVEGYVRAYVAMTDPQATAVVLWIAHTHAIGAAECTPYLWITSAEKGSGKTRLLEVADVLVYRPWLTGRTTAAVLPRKIDAVTPTLLLDESDAAFKGDKEYAEALRGTLNTGYRRSGKATVCVGQGAEITFKDFDTFCAKAIAGLGRLPDTVQDRSIRIALKKRMRGERVERFRQRDAKADAAPIHDQLMSWAIENEGDLTTARPELPDGLGDRAQDVWEPLLAIADRAGGDWGTAARAAAVELSGEGNRDDDSVGVQLLSDIRAAFNGSERLPTAELLEALHQIEESPWCEWGRARKPLTGHALAKLLKPYGIGPHSDGTSRGYRIESFEDAFARYLPSESSKRQEPASQSQKTPISDRQLEPGSDASESAAIPLPEPNPDALTLENRGRADPAAQSSPRGAIQATAKEEAVVAQAKAKFGDDLGDLHDPPPETLEPERPADARDAPRCRCEPPMLEHDDDGDPSCALCGRRLP